MIDFSGFTHLSFDCYGTLIDWETGILEAFSPILRRHGVSVDEPTLLRLYATFEEVEEAGPYKPYRGVLRAVVARIGTELSFSPSEAERDTFAASAVRWPPFGDTTEALFRLARRYKLVILSNVDDDIFEQTAGLLQTRFDEVITAQQVGSYKPSPANFHALLERLETTREKVLHVAQSLYHDHAPAKRFGLSTVWINRPSRWPGIGVALPAEASPDLELPDLRSLADVAGL